jgi:hypothetical protein
LGIWPTKGGSKASQFTRGEALKDAREDENLLKYRASCWISNATRKKLTQLAMSCRGEGKKAMSEWTQKAVARERKGGELAIVLSKGASRVISDELLEPGLTNGRDEP